VDLEEFIEQTLVQIQSGIKKAQEQTRIEGRHPREADRINPRVMDRADHAPKGKYYTSQVGSHLVQFVDFDVAVTADRASGSSGGGSLRIAGIGVGAELESSDRDMTVSRIRFQVPIIFPRADDEEQLN
jgi:hypothetical protein